MEPIQQIQTFYSVEELKEYAENNEKNQKKLVQKLFLTFTEKRVKDFELLIQDLQKSNISFDHFYLSLDQPEDEDDEDHVDGQDPIYNIMQESKQEKILNYLCEQNKIHKLKGLSLYYDRNQVKKGGDLYKKYIEQLTELEVLELSFNDNFLTGFFAVPLLQAIEKCQKLKKLQLLFDENKIKSSEQFCNQIYQTLKSLKNLEHIEFSFCENQGFNGLSVDKIVQALEESVQEKPNLKHLEFHFDGSSIKNIQIIQRLQNLVKLLNKQGIENVIFSFEDCKLKDEQLELLREIQNENRYYKIQFDDQKQDWDDFYGLKKEIQKSNESYKEILDNCFEINFEFPDQAIMMHDIKFLIEKFESVTKNVSILELDLAKNDVNEAYLKRVCEYLKQCKKLKKLELNLANNELSDASNEECFTEQFFKTYKYLDIFGLDVFGNKKLTDLFFQNLCQQINRNNSLMGYLSEFKLYLGDSQNVTDKTCQNLVKLFANLLKIEDLSLSLFKCPQITVKGIMQILDCLLITQAKSNLRNIEISFMELGLSSQDVIQVINHVKELAGNIELVHLWGIEIDLSKNGEDKDYEEIKKASKQLRNQFPMIKVVYNIEKQQEEETKCKSGCSHHH